MIIKLDEFNMVSFNNRRAVRKNHTKPVTRWRKHRILPRNFHHLISKLTFGSALLLHQLCSILWNSCRVFHTLWLPAISDTRF